VVDNADMQRVARMVAETQRVRLLWDDQRMRQTTAAYGLDRLGKTMAAAYGLDRLGKTMAAAHRERMRPLFNTPKFVGPMFGGELQRAAQAMAEAHRASIRRRLTPSGRLVCCTRHVDDPTRGLRPYPECRCRNASVRSLKAWTFS
jgi:hypothetical protein